MVPLRDTRALHIVIGIINMELEIEDVSRYMMIASEKLWHHNYILADTEHSSHRVSIKTVEKYIFSNSFHIGAHVRIEISHSFH